MVYQVRGTATEAVFPFDSSGAHAGVSGTATVAGLGVVLAMLPMNPLATTFYALGPTGLFEQLPGAAGSSNYLLKWMIPFRGRGLYIARSGLLGEWFPSGLDCPPRSLGVGDGNFVIDLLDGSFLAGGVRAGGPALSVVRPKAPTPAAPCQ
jgi:hypothetical protein